MSTKAKILTGVAVVAVIGGIVYAINIPEAIAPVDQAVSSSKSFEGRATCLPHKDRTGEQTLECALGLKTDAGTFYALDGSGLEPGALITLNESVRVRVSGLVVPIEAISSDTWARYDIIGIMRVNIVEKLK